MIAAELSRSSPDLPATRFSRTPWHRSRRGHRRTHHHLLGADRRRFGLLLVNAPPAQIFMGDTGSLALGGLLGAVAVAAEQEFRPRHRRWPLCARRRFCDRAGRLLQADRQARLSHGADIAITSSRWAGRAAGRRAFLDYFLRVGADWPFNLKVEVTMTPVETFSGSKRRSVWSWRFGARDGARSRSRWRQCRRLGRWRRRALQSARARICRWRTSQAPIGPFRRADSFAGRASHSSDAAFDC